MTRFDPDLPLNCPKCGKTVPYQATVQNIHIYNCATDGRMCLRPDGRFGPAEGVERWFSTSIRDEGRARDAVVALRKRNKDL
ncbi:MAG TPA: hypothetical protein VNJ04_04060 [Gemmatimonadaceae bacterium]|nr:hypothetical protein [Gemmatimonadaceae bacterium]